MNKHIKKEEKELHCRRRTRGTKQTTELLGKLLDSMEGAKANDSLGVPLFHHEKMKKVWEVQKRHVKCIQDPPGINLYVQTGTLKKGTVELKTYRSARGSTSLESFHLHLNRFIPGMYKI